MLAMSATFATVVVTEQTIETSLSGVRGANGSERRAVDGLSGTMRVYKNQLAAPEDS